MKKATARKKRTKARIERGVPDLEAQLAPFLKANPDAKIKSARVTDEKTNVVFEWHVIEKAWNDDSIGLVVPPAFAPKLVDALIWSNQAKASFRNTRFPRHPVRTTASAPP
jgi:hypothetical protein